MDSINTTNHSSPTLAAGSSTASSPVTKSRANGSKRKRSGVSVVDSSPGAEDQDTERNEERSRHPPKRACNECRQQKLRCDVTPDPFTRCSRCHRLKLDCRIDANFKRVGKRSKNAEMEREIVELRKQLAEKDGQPNGSPSTSAPVDSLRPARVFIDMPTQPPPLTNLHQGVAGSLLDLRHGNNGSQGPSSNMDSAKYKRLDSIVLGPDRIDDLFKEYWTNYHPFLPFLDPEKSANEYYELSSLLFWTIITVAARRHEPDPTLLTGIANPLSQLVWSTIAAVPQNYHVAKALAILCTWPLPTKSTSSDQTFMLSGIMMQIALQCGLHRPSHNQEFSRFRVELREEDIQDRLQTWAVCNIVAQATSTAYGQPPKTLYDYTLRSLSFTQRDNHDLNPSLYWRLKTEIFCNKVSQKFYNNRDDPIGIASDQERAAWISLLLEEYVKLARCIDSYATPFERLYLQAAGLHLRLSAFFDSSSAPNYAKDLVQLHFAATEFLQSALELQTQSGSALMYFPVYIMQLMLAGGFTLMKLLNSFFCRHIDAEASRRLFSNTIRGIRGTSITNNDLPARLAEVLAQLWRSHGAGMGPRSNSAVVDNSLQLGVRCRMSMSLVYDSVWCWREQFQFKGDGTTSMLDSAVANNPTNPDGIDQNNPPAGNSITNGGDGKDAFNNGHSNSMIISNSVHKGESVTDVLMAPPPNAVTPIPLPEAAPSLPQNDPYVDYNYEVFDPLTWILDGVVDLSYSGNGLGDTNGQGLFGPT